MKKTVVAIAVVVLVAAGIVLPAGYFGQQTERLINERLANMPFGYQAEVVDYQRNWFSSTARIEWRPLAGLFPQAPDAVDGGLNPDGSQIDLEWLEELLGAGPLALDLEIAHGPVFFALGGGVGLFRAHGRIDLGTSELGAAPDSSGRDNGIIDVFLSSFSGRTVANRVELPGLELDTGVFSMQLTGAEVEGEWSAPESFELQRIDLESFDLDLGELVSASMRMRNLSAVLEYPQGMPTGALLAPAIATSSMEEFVLAGSGGSALVRMSGMTSIDTMSLDESGIYSGESSGAIESMEFFGREFSDARIEQAFGGFSEAAFMNYVSAVMEWSSEELEAWPLEEPQEEPSGASRDWPEQGPAGAPAGLPQELLQVFHELLVASPYFDMDVDLVYQQEHALNLDMHLGYDGERAPAVEDMGNLLALLAGAEYSLDFEMPVAAAEDLLGQGILQMALMQGLFQQTETNYRMSVALKDGVLKLNGMPVPLPLPGTAPAAPPNAPPPVPPG